MVAKSKAVALLSTAALLVSTLAACSSEGGTRLGSVGLPSGSAGAGDGSTGSGDGTTGSGGDGSGSTGTGGTGSGSGDTGTGTGGTGTGTGSGSTGSGSTGTGGSQGTLGLGQVLVTAGNAVMDTGDGVGGVVTPVNQTLPATTPITGSIINTDKDLGQTLVDVGNGKQVLVKGILGAIGDTVAITGLNTAITTPTTGSPIIGLGALSNSQPVGTVATLGVLTDGKTATATVNGVANQLLQEVTPGTLTGLAKLQVANATLGTAANPLVGVSALSNTAANGQLVSATALPTNGGSTATANVPVVGQVVQTVASATGGTGATGLVGVTAGNTTIGSTSPAVGVNVASATPVTGSVVTATVPVVAAVTPVVGSVLPGIGAATTPSASTPVANVVTPVAAVVTPVAGSVLPAVGATVNAVVAPAGTTPVKSTVTNLLGGHH